MQEKREVGFIGLFLSAYENGSWANASGRSPEASDRRKPAVEWVATRKSDGNVLAIEHTIIEPFVGEKQDFASFARAGFLSIEEDCSLPVPGIWIEVFVPAGTLRNRPPTVRTAIVHSVRDWLKVSRLTLPQGDSQHSCPMKGAAASASVELTVRVTPLARGDRLEPGAVHIRRQQTNDDLADIIEKALRKKLPKLVNTPADRRILLLERQHMNPAPKRMLGEIDQRRALFPELARVDEIWILETVFYGMAFGGTYLRFELYENGGLARSYDFRDGKLLTRFENGLAEVVNSVG